MILAGIKQAIYKQGHKGAVALAFGGAVGVLAALGAGLIFAALVMGMAMLMGAIWACVILGVVFLGLAAGLIALRKEQRPPPPAPTPPFEEIIFTLAFVAARAIIQGRSNTAGE